MLKFAKWLLESNWFPLRSDDRINDNDNPPQRTSNGDYIVYHGTNIINARVIFKNRQLKFDNMGVVGISTHPSRADVFGAMKAKKGVPGVVLQIVIDKGWLEAQDITREVGGSGRDQFLIHAEVPPEAIKDIQLARVSGTPLKQGQMEYPSTQEDSGFSGPLL
jgi:hypothetical protein